MYIYIYIYVSCFRSLSVLDEGRSHSSARTGCAALRWVQDFCAIRLQNRASISQPGINTKTRFQKGCCKGFCESCAPQRAQYPLRKEYTLKHQIKAPIV